MLTIACRTTGSPAAVVLRPFPGRRAFGRSVLNLSEGRTGERIHPSASALATDFASGLQNRL